ncbi:MAG: 5-methyltetrahydropteroyltriglutamate--homocysteine S-methyltransferase [Xanthobacteraceae bacterium]
MASAAHIHVDHVGSLLRPMALRAARERVLGVHDADHNLGAHDNTEMRAIEDGFVREVVKLQEDAGLPLITDGEFRRRSWWTDFYLSLTGIGVTYSAKTPMTMINAKGEVRPFPSIVVKGRVKWHGSQMVEPFRFLKATTKRTPKVSLPAPPMIHFIRSEDFVPSVYPSLDEFYNDLIMAYRQEVKALADAGCKVLQLDECMLPLLCDPRHQAYARARGEDPQKLIETYTWLIDQAISERPKDMVVGLHLCRGNLNAFWGADGAYDPVADAIFNKTSVDYYLLEYDTPRAGDFSPLRLAPKGKQVLLGLVSTKDEKLEDKDMLLRRIDEASKQAPHAQLGICPQCGFSTNLFGTQFTIDDERRKLELIVDVANKAWH